jgi:hypothetical protein
MDDWNEDPAAALAEAERRLAAEGKGWWWRPVARFQALNRLPANFGLLQSRHADLSKTRIAVISGLASRPDLDSLVLNEHVSARYSIIIRRTADPFVRTENRAGSPRSLRPR